MTESTPPVSPSRGRAFRKLALLGAAAAATAWFVWSPAGPTIHRPGGDASPTPLGMRATVAGEYLSAISLERGGQYGDALARLSHAIAMAPEAQRAALRADAFRLAVLAGDVPVASRLAAGVPIGPATRIDPRYADLAVAVQMGDATRAQAIVESMKGSGIEGVLAPLLSAWVGVMRAPNSQPVTPDSLTLTRTVNGPFLFYQLGLMNDLKGQSDHALTYYRKALTGRGVPQARLYQAAGHLLLTHGDTAGLEDFKHTLTVAAGGAENDLRLNEVDLSKPVVAGARQGIAELYYVTGHALAAEGLYERATMFLRLALYLRPDLPPAQSLLAFLLEEGGYGAQALTVYAGIDPATPLGQRARLRHALLLAKEGQVEQAVKDLRAMRDAKDPTVSIALGDILRMQERFEEAASEYDRALAASDAVRDVRLWPVYYARGICHERTGKWQKAEADFTQALALEPDQPDVANYLAYSWIERGENIPRAKEMLARAVEMRPTDANIVDSYGWALYTLGEWRLAVDYLELAVELMPYDPTVNDHLGDVYYRLGRATEAGFQWRRVLTLKPEGKVEAQVKRKLSAGLPPASAPTRQAASRPERLAEGDAPSSTH